MAIEQTAQARGSCCWSRPSLPPCPAAVKVFHQRFVELHARVQRNIIDTAVTALFGQRISKRLDSSRRIRHEIHRHRS